MGKGGGVITNKISSDEGRATKNKQVIKTIMGEKDNTISQTKCYKYHEGSQTVVSYFLSTFTDYLLVQI